MAREERYRAFEDFLTSGKAMIDDIEKKYGSEDFRRLYVFYAVPRGRNGGNDNTIFEYFYGNRPYDKAEHAYFKEQGATLLYSRGDDGYVSCQLYPAKSERRSQLEDFIFLQMHLSPQKLSKSILKKHFKYFLSYMKTTSLDGNPSFLDMARVKWIKLTKYIYQDNLLQPPRWRTAFFKMCKLLWPFIVAIGGGLILILIQKKFNIF